MRKFLFGAAALALAATPAISQGVQGGLVNVQVPVTVLNGSLNNNEIEILKNVGVNVAAPINVQVPIGIAANVCPDVTAAVLAEQMKNGGGASCTATTASRALGQQILRQNARGKQ